MRCLLCGLCLLWTCSAAGAETEFKIITLQHRFGQDLLPAVQPLVGPDGTASAIDNHLLIQASPERMVAIEQAIATLDTELRTLRIRVSRSHTGHESSANIGAGGEIRRGDVSMQLPGRNGRHGDGVVVEMGRQDISSSERSSEQISVLEGARAVIGVGQSVPFTGYWLELTRHYAHVQQTVQYRDITTGFAVRPRMIGQEVELEIAPRISRLANDGAIEFQELATTVRIPTGLWFDLGGTMHANDEVSRAILSRATDGAAHNAQLWIIVE